MKNENDDLMKISMETIDELKFVDKDIKDEFLNKNYIVGTAIQIQLARVIRELTMELRSQKINS